MTAPPPALPSPRPDLVGLATAVVSYVLGHGLAADRAVIARLLVGLDPADVPDLVGAVALLASRTTTWLAANGVDGVT